MECTMHGGEHLCSRHFCREHLNDGITMHGGELQKCPRCGKMYPRLLALSRADNSTMICDRCGVEEALESIPAPLNTSQVYKDFVEAIAESIAEERTGGKNA